MIQKIGVIGAGQMGNGIAHVCAVAGYDVTLQDINREQIDKALKTISRNMDRQVSKHLLQESEKVAALTRIHPTDKLEALGGVDLVIEAATEDEGTKRKIFAAICPVLKQGAIIATNTSSISVTRLASATDRPEKFMGMHFMNPVPVMQLVELIRGIATDEGVFKTVNDFVETLGKTTAVSED